MSSIILASGNQGKIREFQALFADSGVDIILQTELGIADAEETGLTFVENALLKARHAAKIGGRPAVADDSGLVVPALGGAPGIYSARYAGVHGDDAKNNAKLLTAMADISDRRAYFVCTIVYLEYEADPLPLIAQGIWHGEIAHAAKGSNGFGYNPIFRAAGQTRTAAEMQDHEKNSISHRAQALGQFLEQYLSRYA